MIKEPSTQDLGEALLADLNALLQPAPGSILPLEQLRELRAAGVAWSRIQALYPLDLTPYAPAWMRWWSTKTSTGR